MKKRIQAALLALALLLGLAACNGQEEASPPASQSQVSSAGSQEEPSSQSPTPRSGEGEPSSQVESVPEEEPAQEGLVLVQQESGAEAGYEPTITLYPDGTFALAAAFYDGTAQITGTYVSQDGGYVLTPTDSTAQGVAGSDVGEMGLTPSGEGYTYSGGQLGLTFDGASFLPEGA